jgi:hypothetical protein
MPHTLKHPAEGGDRAGMLVGDDQPDPGQPALAQGAQEAAPEHLVFGVADVTAENLPAAVGGHPGRHDHDHRGDLPRCDAHVEIGGVEEHIRERGVVQRPGPERLDLLVQPGTDPRHLRLGRTLSAASGIRSCTSPAWVAISRGRLPLRSVTRDSLRW